MAAFALEDHFGVMEKRAGGGEKVVREREREKGESKREAWSHGQVGRLVRDWFLFFVSALFALEVVK